ncbi:RNA polymerase sigma factor [Natronohydrobacter thiooxidans]|jgi:RNA polymerase sigma factor (sigma-70 family)|uniref:RNA polymerase sigma factor n=1 Tax=Natronohydrobacter thiooxidans TaxID=87172 RepID=UPI0008FF7340|nr:sigma-70 family RNA polymerase sigma factor [Natronohydrobacter thiooxidans]
MDQGEKLRALLALHVAGARMGRSRDFRALVELAGPRLFAHARRLADDADTARDLVQEAWAAITGSLPALRDDRAFLPWALAIVTRAAAREVARRVRARETAKELSRAADAPGADPPDLRAAIAELPAGQRAVLALFYLEGLTVAEVATALAIPPGTVKTRLMHARSRLRVLMTGEDHGRI